MPRCVLYHNVGNRAKHFALQVIPVTSGSKTLKDAVNEAMRDWVANLTDTHYCVGSAIGPHPFPTIVRDYQRVIGREIKQQLFEKIGKLPDAVVACVGGGSNAIGTFYDFIKDEGVRLVGVEAGGDGTFGNRGRIYERIANVTRRLQVLTPLDTPPHCHRVLPVCCTV